MAVPGGVPNPFFSLEDLLGPQDRARAAALQGAPTLGEAVGNAASNYASGVADRAVNWPAYLHQYMTSTSPMQQGMDAGMAFAPGGIRAWHGSPYNFPAEPGYPLGRFRNDKIGTGEGAAAYGVGHYFGGAEGTARSYRDALSNPDRIVPDAEAIAKLGGGWDALRARISPLHDQMMKTYNAEARQKLLDQIEPIRQQMDTMHAAMVDDTIKRRGAGHMYEVNIAAEPHQLLDWDKPLSQMGDPVKKALNDAWLAHPEDHAGQTGEQIYRNNTPGFVSSGPYREPLHAKASETFRDAGIPGIQYLDQGSRGKPDIFYDLHMPGRGAVGTYNTAAEAEAAGKMMAKYGGGEGGQVVPRQVDHTRNYVIFNPDLITILRKYGIAGLLAGGGAASALTAPGGVPEN